MKKKNMSFFDKLITETKEKLKSMDIDDVTILIRRVFIVITLWFIVILFLNKMWRYINDGIKSEKGEEIQQEGEVKEDKIQKLDTYYSIKNNQVYFKQLKIEKADVASFKSLGSKYAKDINHAYYKGEIIENVSPEYFTTIENDINQEKGLIVNSDNLLTFLEYRPNRLFLMNDIGGILQAYANVKGNLKWASENSMWKFKEDLPTLEKYKRSQDIPQQQRAKFAVIFLYIKIIKNTESDEIKMKMAMTQLRKFIEEGNIEDLPKEIQNKDMETLKGDIATDKYCMYIDGELFTCFLDKIFK